MRPARGVTLAAAAALTATLWAGGCARPPDEAWLRFLGFRGSGSSSALTLLEGALRDEKTDTVDAAFENASAILGNSAAGTGILVKRVRVEYRIAGGAPPAQELPVTLYLPARAAADSDTSATLSGLPIVPASLKQWILASGLPSNPEVSLTAHVTFFAETDEGNGLEVEGSLAIVLSNTGGSGGGGTASVSVDASVAAASEDPLVAGRFTISRSGATISPLTVFYSLSGTAVNGTDYQRLDGSASIASGSSTASVVVTPVADGTVESPETVVLTLTASASYQLGSPRTATVTISD